jgi:hypothetical protein
VELKEVAMPTWNEKVKANTKAFEGSMQHDTRLSFCELMQLTPITLKLGVSSGQTDAGNATTFMSRRIPWSPGQVAYGGHVYAQSVWAASQAFNEVENGMVVHVSDKATDGSWH